MANPIVLACPECQKQLKAPPELQGKKVRCKGCGHVFPVVAPAPAKPAPAAKKAAPAKAAPAKPKSDDEDTNPYGVMEEENTVARCPHCAGELESEEARICIHCGYDTVTRQRVGTKKVIENTGQDVFMWLLPGFGAIAGIVLLIVLDFVYCLAVPGWVEGGDYSWTAYGGFRVWWVIMSLFGIYFMGRFAVKRLIFNNKPPEREVG